MCLLWVLNGPLCCLGFGCTICYRIFRIFLEVCLLFCWWAPRTQAMSAKSNFFLAWEESYFSKAIVSQSELSINNRNSVNCRLSHRTWRESAFWGRGWNLGRIDHTQNLFKNVLVQNLLTNLCIKAMCIRRIRILVHSFLQHVHSTTGQNRRLLKGSRLVYTIS